MNEIARCSQCPVSSCSRLGKIQRDGKTYCETYLEMRGVVLNPPQQTCEGCPSPRICDRLGKLYPETSTPACDVAKDQAEKARQKLLARTWSGSWTDVPCPYRELIPKAVCKTCSIYRCSAGRSLAEMDKVTVWDCKKCYDELGGPETVGKES